MMLMKLFLCYAHVFGIIIYGLLQPQISITDKAQIMDLGHSSLEAYPQVHF